MSCMAVIRPLSPTTYAEPPGRWSSRKSAVARAEVKMWSSGTSIPLPSSRPRDRVLLVHEHAVHVGQPGVDRLLLRHTPILALSWPSGCIELALRAQNLAARANSTDREGQLNGPRGPTQRTARANSTGQPRSTMAAT